MDYPIPVESRLEIVPMSGIAVNNVQNNLCSKIQLSKLNIKVQRTPVSSKSWTGVVEDSGCS